MFGSIAPSYDALNHTLSFNLDRGWRRRAARAVAPEPGARILDLCGGTGDLSIALLRMWPDAAPIVCADFAHPMLRIANRKLGSRAAAGRFAVVEADALHLPFADRTFDAAAVAFGVRNLADLDRGLREILRVLRPGGRLVILEFSRPGGRLLGAIYGWYLNRVLPRIGDGASGVSGPYRYLAGTIGEFPEPAAFAGRIREAGFAAAGWTPLTGGIVCIHVAYRGP